MRLLTCIFVSMTTAWSAWAMSSQPQAKTELKPEVITIFFTGNTLGQLKPCGCSGGQLGGFDKRQGIFNTAEKSKRLIVDTGLLIEQNSEQDLIKFNILFQAFELLDYDLISLTKDDVKTARNLGLLQAVEDTPKIISYQFCLADANLPAKFKKQFSLKGKKIDVTIAAFSAESKPLEKIKELFEPASGRQKVNILILDRCNGDIISSIAKLEVVDCLVCPAEFDEAEVISRHNESPMVFSTGRYGKYVGKLQIASNASGKLNFDFAGVPVSENLPQQTSLVQLYEFYQQLVKEANLLEKQSRFPLQEGLKYVGSKSCKACHNYEYNKWSVKPHAKAYQTLVNVGSQFDPECVVCHVIGMEYDGGFISEKKTPDLKNVGCENCHGPGSEHIESGGVKPTAEPKFDCIQCHTTEHSAEYAGNEKLYFEKIIHWREPNTADNVNNK